MWASSVAPLLLAMVLLLLERSADVHAVSKHACEGEILHIACYPNTVAYVRSAMFGKQKGTPKPPYRCGDRMTLYRDCQRDMTHYFKHHCHGKNKCDVTIDSGAFGGTEFCVDVLKFAEIVYDCVPMTTITAVESCQDKCLPPPSVIQFIINKYAPAPAPGKPGAASPAAAATTATRPGAPPVLPLNPSRPGQGHLPPPPPQLRTQLRSPTSAIRTPGVVNRNPNNPSSGPPNNNNNNNRGFNNAGPPPPPRPPTRSNAPLLRPPPPPNAPIRRGPPPPPTRQQQQPGFAQQPPVASLPYGNSRFAAALSRFTPNSQGITSFLNPQQITGRSSSSRSSGISRSSSGSSRSSTGGSPPAASAPPSSSSSSNANAGFSFPQTNARPQPYIPARHAALSSHRNTAVAGLRPPPPPRQQQQPAPTQPAGLQLNHNRQPSPSGGSGGSTAAISRTDKLSLLSRMQGLLAELRAKKEAAAAKAAAAEAAAV